VTEWEDLFLPRQKLQLLSYLGIVERLNHRDDALGRILKQLLGAAPVRARGKSPLTGDPGVALTNIWKGGSHEEPI
jgi:hypothetical protein